jgi:hypothetical protein
VSLSFLKVSCLNLYFFGGLNGGRDSMHPWRLAHGALALLLEVLLHGHGWFMRVPRGEAFVLAVLPSVFLNPILDLQ